MNPFRKYVSLYMLIFIIPVFVMAGSDKQTGTAGALELLIPPDAAGAGLGGACVAYVQGIESLHWNPAGIVRTKSNVEAFFSQLDYFSDIKLNYVALQGRWKQVGMFAFGLKRINFGEIPVTTEYAPDGTGELFSPGFTMASLTYGTSILDRLQVGVSFKYISENIATVNATGFALDVGIQYELNQRFRIGVAIRNWGPKMRFDGAGLNRKVYLPGSVDDPVSKPEQLRIQASEFEIPTVVDMGVTCHVLSFENHILILNGTFQNQHLGWDRYGMGAVWQIKMTRGSIHFKSGIQAAFRPESHTFHFHDEQSLLGPSVGLGIDTPFLRKTNLSFNYAYVWTEYFENIQWLSLAFRFSITEKIRN